MRVSFRDFELDMATFELRRGSDVIPLEPQVLSVLAYLIEHRDRVVPKTELLDEIWGDRFVSESALTSRISDMRRAVDDDGSRQEVIKTVHGRGYRFVAAAQESDVAAAVTPTLTARGQTTLGRDADVQALADRLESDRLVSITGPGGIGKTHLLSSVVETVGPRFDRIVLAELVLVDDGDALGPYLLQVLGIADSSSADPVELVLRHLEDQALLLLLDNAEHLRAEVADLCRAILRRCPDVFVLVTTQRRLSVIGESIQALDGLDLASSIELFVASARRAGAEVDPTGESVIELCRQLDGMPLAIELAAARTRVLSIDDVLERVQHALSVATGDSHRHASLEAALAWSLQTLPEVDRAVLEDLTVFTGPFDLPAAEAVSPELDVAGSIMHLCDQSLVVPMPEARSSFRILEPIRWFAADTHADLDQARNAHAALFVERAEASAEEFAAGDAHRGYAALQRDWANIRSAFRHLLAADAIDPAARLVVAVFRYAEIRSLSEVRQWTQSLAAAFVAAGAVQPPELVAAQVRFTAHAGDLDRAIEIASGLPSDDTAYDVVMARLALNHYQGNLDEAQRYAAAASDLLGAPGSLTELLLLMTKVFIASSGGGSDAESVDRMSTVSTSCGEIGEVFSRLATAARADWTGDREASIAELDEAIGHAESIGFTFVAQSIASYRSLLLVALDDADRAASLVAHSIGRGVETGAWSLVASDLAIASKILVDRGDPGVAAELLAAREAAGYHVAATDWVAALMTAVLTETLGPELEPRLAAGALLGLPDAAGVALSRLEA